MPDSVGDIMTTTEFVMMIISALLTHEVYFFPRFIYVLTYLFLSSSHHLLVMERGGYDNHHKTTARQHDICVQ